MLAPSLTALVALASFAVALRDDPPEDCLEQYCAAARVSTSSGSSPLGVTFSVTPLPEFARGE